MGVPQYRFQQRGKLGKTKTVTAAETYVRLRQTEVDMRAQQVSEESSGNTYIYLIERLPGCVKKGGEVYTT
jgi:hypothetical protein